MNTTEQNSSGLDRDLPVVDIAHPGFFPYARFSHSTPRNRQSGPKPLAQNSEFAVWPNALPETRSSKASVNRYNANIG
jgi:hypothetical protein